MPTRDVYVIQPADRPTPWLDGGVVLRRFARTLATEADLLDALALHTGPDDVPADTPHALVRLRDQLARGRVLVQHRIVAPAEPPGQPVVAPPDADGVHAPALSCHTVARALGLSKRRVYRARALGLVDQTPGGLVALTPATDAFAARHAAWRRVSDRPFAGDLDLPLRGGNAHSRGAPHVTEADIREADRRGEVAARESGGKLFVYTDARWLRWFAERMGAHELEAHESSPTPDTP